MPEDIDDLRSRSMRCNLLFHGFPEEKCLAARKDKNCATLVLDYVSDIFEIPNAHQTIKIERSHRLGTKYDYRKSRPIVVMFNHYPDKLLVKQKEAWKKCNDSRKSTPGATAPQASGTDGSDTLVVMPPQTMVRMDEAELTTPVKPMISVSDQFTKSIQDRRKFYFCI